MSVTLPMKTVSLDCRLAQRSPDWEHEHARIPVGSPKTRKQSTAIARRIIGPIVQKFSANSNTSVQENRFAAPARGTLLSSRAALFRYRDPLLSRLQVSHCCGDAVPLEAGSDRLANLVEPRCSKGDHARARSAQCYTRQTRHSGHSEGIAQPGDQPLPVRLMDPVLHGIPEQIVAPLLDGGDHHRGALQILYGVDTLDHLRQHGARFGGLESKHGGYGNNAHHFRPALLNSGYRPVRARQSDG